MVSEDRKLDEDATMLDEYCEKAARFRGANDAKILHELEKQRQRFGTLITSPQTPIGNRVPKDIYDAFKQVCLGLGLNIGEGLAQAMFDFIITNEEKASKFNVQVVKPAASVSLKLALLKKEIEDCVAGHLCWRKRLEEDKKRGQRRVSENSFYAFRLRDLIMKGIPVPIELIGKVEEILKEERLV